MFFATERITHIIVLNCARLSPVTQLSNWIDALDIVELIELSPTALCLDIKEKMGHSSFSKKTVILA